MDPQEVDGWIAQLGQCKQLSEPDVKRLCEKVSIVLGFRCRLDAPVRNVVWGICGAQGLDRVVTEFPN
jgi:hypothetical protein